MVSTIKFQDGKEFFYEHRDSDASRSPRMGTHHYHRLFEVYYFEKGDCKYFIDDRTYSLLPGDVILIPGNVIHRTLYTGTYERKLMNFTHHFIPESVAMALPPKLYLYRNHGVSKEIKGIFEAIDKEYSSRDDHSESVLTSLVNLLFILIARNENKMPQAGGNSMFVAETVKHISEFYYQTDISLNSIAETYSVSPEHLSRSFKKETGFGFNEYLTLVRLQKAEQFLLDKHRKSISEIAYSCGFNDSNYFSDRFKKAYGISPLKYRKREENGKQKA